MVGRLHKPVAAVLGLLVLLLGVVFNPATAQAADPITSDPAKAAASWLARQLVDGDHIEVVFGGNTFPDYGLTADVVLALDAAGVGSEEAGAATNYLADHAGEYAGLDFGDAYAGPFAKLLLVALAQGADPTDFGGINLIQALLGQETDTGRFSDESDYGDFSNTITQSLAIISLVRAATADPSMEAVETLLDLQCDDGGFPAFFPISDPDPDPGPGAECESDADATGFAVQALVAVGAGPVVPSTAIDDAIDWLLSVQGDDGSFESGPPDPTPNANSTALAIAALRLGSEETEAAAGIDYLLSLQIGCAGAAADEGAIGFSAAVVDDSTARATAQAIPALAGVNLLNVSGTETSEDLPVFDCPPDPSPTPTEPTPDQGDPTEQPSPSTTPTTGPAPSTPASTPTTPAAQPGASLPNTGLALGGLVVFGAVLAAVGTGLLRIRHGKRS